MNKNNKELQILKSISPALTKLIKSNTIIDENSYLSITINRLLNNESWNKEDMENYYIIKKIYDEYSTFI